MKKILITANSLDIGGIETSLINFLKYLDKEEYDVTLILQNGGGRSIPLIPKSIKVNYYEISKNPNKIKRKIYNRFKLFKWIADNYNKYDVSICFTTSCQPSALLARYSSNYNIFWVHSNYELLYNYQASLIKKFFNRVLINKFSRIVFVSNEAKLGFLKYYPQLEYKAVVCNNFIDIEMIKEKADIKGIAPISKKKVFLHVGRHVEGEKKLTRLIDATKILKEDYDDFEVWLVGDGPDNEIYQKKVKDLELEDTIKFFGLQMNPYPFFKNADAFVLCSDYEGFPVVYMESLIFELPIITTIQVTDPFMNIKDHYGLIVDKDSDALAKGMAKFLKSDLPKFKKFDPEKHNERVAKTINKIINRGEDNED